MDCFRPSLQMATHQHHGWRGPFRSGYSRKTTKKAAYEAAQAARTRAFYTPEEVENFNQCLKQRCGIPAELQQRCIAFFDAAYTHENRLIARVVAKVGVTRETAIQLYMQWLITKDHSRAINVLKTASNTLFSLLQLGEEPPANWPRGGHMISCSWKRSLDQR